MKIYFEAYYARKSICFHTCIFDKSHTIKKFKKNSLFLSINPPVSNHKTEQGNCQNSKY